MLDYEEKNQEERIDERVSGVGVTLTEVRESMGLSREDVAMRLRIRTPYLQAIEEGRFHDLPGAAYASGFVRGYAEYLGLDGDEMIRRFKSESGVSFREKRGLDMPSVPSEERIPGGAIIFIAVILAVVFYGVWQYSVSEDKSVVEMITVIPEKMMEFVSDAVHDREDAEAIPAGDNTQPSLPEMESSPSPLPERSSPSAVQTGAGVTPPAETESASVPPIPVPETSSSQSAAVMPSDEKPQNATVETAVVATDASPVVTSTSVPETLATPPSQSLENVAASPAPASAGTSAPPVAAVVPDTPSSAQVTFGQSNVGGRIIVRATTQQVWMRVSDKSNRVVFERTLRPGESYRVPDQTGLKLRVGNAPAVELLVDGKLLTIERSSRSPTYTVTLDPDELAGRNTPLN